MPEPTFNVTKVVPDGDGQRHITGLIMTGPQAATALADPTTCDDIIHEEDWCGLSARGCWHLRSYMPAQMRERYDAERAAESVSLFRHPEGLVWFRSPGHTL